MFVDEAEQTADPLDILVGEKPVAAATVGVEEPRLLVQSKGARVYIE